MSELVYSDNNPLGNMNTEYEVSKIVDYGLDQYVIDLHLKGFKNSKIADLCNKQLFARKDSEEYKDIKYTPVNHMNVFYFLRTKIKEIEMGKAPLAQYSKRAFDVLGELEKNVLVIQEEMEKLRDPEQQIQEARSQTFLRMFKELNKTLEIISNVQGKTQPSITLNVFEANINKFCDRILKCKDLEDKMKGQIIDWAVLDLIPESSLKQAQGEEKKDE